MSNNLISKDKIVFKYEMSVTLSELRAIITRNHTNSKYLEVLANMTDEEILKRFDYIKSMIEDRCYDDFNEILREFFIRNEP